MIIGIDAGGTNVDGVLVGEDGIEETAKTAHEESPESVRETVHTLLDARDPSAVERVVLATTLVLNAAVEERLEPCTNILIPGPGLRPKRAFFGEENLVVAGCVDHRGRITEEMDVDASPTHDVIAVTAKFSPRNPTLEKEVKEELDLPARRTALGHEAGGELGFPARAATTVFNARGRPVFEEFARETAGELSDLGVESPLYYMKSDGAMVAEEVARKAPAHTARSGPAASALGLLALTEIPRAICVDIGGTTTDISVLESGYPRLEESFEAGDMKARYRAVASKDLAIGGDTEITEKALTGRRAGRAAAFGGTRPTPTDALHVLGEFTEGNREDARKAIAKQGDPEEVSREIINRMTARIAGEMVEFVGTPPDHLLAGGVLAPYLAERIATHLPFSVDVVVPDHAGVAGAVGCAAARVSLLTRVHIDSAQGMMTVSAAGHEAVKHVKKGTTYEEEELRETVESETRAMTERAGGESGVSIEQLHARLFNVVQNGWVQGQIADATAQAKPGLRTFH